jgi:hypothetical protein
MLNIHFDSRISFRNYNLVYRIEIKYSNFKMIGFEITIINNKSDV